MQEAVVSKITGEIFVLALQFMSCLRTTTELWHPWFQLLDFSVGVMHAASCREQLHEVVVDAIGVFDEVVRCSDDFGHPWNQLLDFGVGVSDARSCREQDHGRNLCASTVIHELLKDHDGVVAPLISAPGL